MLIKPACSPDQVDESQPTPGLDVPRSAATAQANNAYRSGEEWTRSRGPLAGYKSPAASKAFVVQHHTTILEMQARKDGP